MTNLKKLTLEALVGGLLLFGISADSQAAKPIDRRTQETYEQTKEWANTPERVADFIKRGIRYQLNNRMQDPIDTYLSDKGDCAAALAINWLRSHGYSAKMIGFYMYKRSWSHAICALKDKNGWRYMDQNKISKGYPTIEHMMQYEAGGYRGRFDIIGGKDVNFQYNPRLFYKGANGRTYMRN